MYEVMVTQYDTHNAIINGMHNAYADGWRLVTVTVHEMGNSRVHYAYFERPKPVGGYEQ